MRIDPDSIRCRVQEEVERRAAAGAASGMAALGQHSVAPNRPWARATIPFGVKEQYQLRELLAYSDVAFVEVCYLAVLRRPADEQGLATHLNHLRSGAMSKVEIVAALRWSPEGTSKGVHIDGLLIPYTVQKWRRKRYIGPLVAYAQGLVRLPRLFDRIAVLDARQAHELQGLGEYVNSMNLRLDAAVRDVQKSLREDSQPRLEVLERMAGNAVSRGCELERALEEQRDQYDGKLREVATEIGADIEQMRAVLEDKAERLAVQESDSARFKLELGKLSASMASIEIKRRERLDLERSLDPLYVAFEEKFRGTRELIRQRVEPYVAVMQEAQVGTQLTPILDIGCGRGDLLDILRENGLVAKGVDSNRVFVDLCRARGLNVVEGDALELLRSLPDAALGGVTGLHIAEHLPFETLVQLLDECRRVLCIGGVLLLETPNPENLLVATQLFYMDPTHRNPLPPEALQWFVEARGFERVRIERLSLGRPMDVPPLLEENVPGAGSVNFLLRQAHVGPDYVVTARRL